MELPVDMQTRRAMNPSRWQRVSQLYHAALAREPNERRAFLERSCAADPALLHEIESLLDCEGDEQFLASDGPQAMAKIAINALRSSLAGRQIGAYTILSLIGAGGMGDVYLAEDSRLHRKVAIKFLRTESMDDERAKKRLLREARAAAALDHPNICAVHEIGDVDDQNFIVMQYVDGETLAERMARQPLEIGPALAIARQVADALADAHGHGIVHRDIKPQNIMLTRRDQVKVLDFGLAQTAASLSAEQATATMLTTRGVIAGTVAYMSPEQVRGEKLDGRSDIFSFGTTLHELVSGEHPFALGTIAETMVAILTRDAPPIRSRAASIPESLPRIIQKCLEKVRERRYQSAGDLVIDLDDAVHDRGTVGSALRDSGVVLPPFPMLRLSTEAPVFVGRAQQLDQLGLAWQLAKTGTRHFVCLGGESGIGKTRLAIEFARACAEREGATVLFGRSDEEALLPYQPFVEVLNWYARVCPETDLRAQLVAAGGGGELGPFVPELHRRIPDLPTPPRTSPESQRYRLFDTVSALLAAMSKVRPTLLLLDDVHWADRPTLLMLKHIMRAADPAALCVIATYRETELRQTHPFEAMAADLRREVKVTRISLGGLEAAQVRILVGALAGSDAPPTLAPAVVESTGGNPFFVGQMVQHLTETGALARLHEMPARTDFLPVLGLPQGVKDVIGRRLSRLSDECHGVLRLAAVVGREFDLAVFDSLGDVAEDRLLDAIDEAIRARLIAETRRGSERFTFVHALIRETLYAELTSSRQMRLHRRVAEAIERLRQGRTDLPLADLAYHFVQAAPLGAADKAIDYATRAGDHAVEALAHEEAARFYAMALQSIEFTASGQEAEARRADLHGRRARAFGALAQWGAQKADLEQALQHLPPQEMGRRCELMLDVANALHWLFDVPSSEQMAKQALELAERAQRPDLLARALSQLANCRWTGGSVHDAMELHHRILAEVSDPPRNVYYMGTYYLYAVGHTNDAVALGNRAAETAGSSHDTTSIMFALSHYGLALGAAGRYEEATKIFGEAREFGRKYGVLPLLARAISMSAGFHLGTFDFDTAEALQCEARELARSVGFVPTVVSGGIDLLLMAARRHEPGPVEQLLRETTEAAAANPGFHEWMWRLRLSQVRAELALARGAFETAVDEASQAIAQSRAMMRLKYETFGLITRARALHALGRTRDALADARHAIDVARVTEDPALLLQAFDTLLGLDGDDVLVGEARTLEQRIFHALPDETMKRRFIESEVVQRIHQL